MQHREHALTEPLTPPEQQRPIGEVQPAQTHADVAVVGPSAIVTHELGRRDRGLLYDELSWSALHHTDHRRLFRIHALRALARPCRRRGKSGDARAHNPGDPSKPHVHAY